MALMDKPLPDDVTDSDVSIPLTEDCLLYTSDAADE